MAAFRELVDSSTPSIYRLARAYVGDASAPDVVQEVFVSAWQELPRLRNPDRFRPWLHRIAVNRCLSVLRRSARVREITTVAETSDATAAPDFRRAVEARLIVGPAFRALSEDHRTLIGLHYAARLSIHEIALALEIPEGTVKSRLNAALTALRSSVGKAE